MAPVITPNLRWLGLRPARWLAFGLGSGLAPKAPGTAGSLAALPLAWAMSGLPGAVSLFLLLAAFVLGVWLCGSAARDLGVHDHGGIVWDEFVGLWLTCWLLPAGLLWWLAAFLLFRLFDILKPWPIRWLDRQVHGGLGIMLDDLVAGLLAWLILQAAALWLGVSVLALSGTQA